MNIYKSMGKNKLPYNSFIRFCYLVKLIGRSSISEGCCFPLVFWQMIIMFTSKVRVDVKINLRRIFTSRTYIY